jgi:outer membrane biosynthesis protein TonB
MKFLLIVLLIAVIAVIGLLAARSRARSTDALPAEDHRDAITPDPRDDTFSALPPDEFTPSAMGGSPLPAEPEPEELHEPVPEPEVVPESVPPVEPDPVVEPLPEPDPIVEPEPPMEPEPIIEPDPQPAEPEPIIEPNTAVGGATHDDPPAADPDEPTDPPQAVIDAGEMPAQELDPHAGWESDEDRTIHADPESGLYHTPDSPGYQIGPDGQVFESEEAAESAGFTRWDQPG